MPSCPHGERVRREGTSAKGPWVGHFCPLKKGDPNQCKPEFEKRGATPTARFNQDLDRSSYAAAQTAKDDTITRLAIIKSMIERGDTYQGLTTNKEFTAWLNLALGKTIPVEPAKHSYGTFQVQEPMKDVQVNDDVSVDEIPF